MGPIDRPTVRYGLLIYGGQSEAPAQGRQAEIPDRYDDDPLAAARGAVNGVFWGTALWSVILWMLLGSNLKAEPRAGKSLASSARAVIVTKESRVHKQTINSAGPAEGWPMHPQNRLQ